MTVKNIATRTLRAELPTPDDEGDEPTSVRFVEAVPTDDGATIGAMLVVTLEEWRKAGSPLKVDASFRPS